MPNSNPSEPKRTRGRGRGRGRGGRRQNDVRRSRSPSPSRSRSRSPLDTNEADQVARAQNVLDGLTNEQRNALFMHYPHPRPTLPPPSTASSDGSNENENLLNDLSSGGTINDTLNGSFVGNSAELASNPSSRRASVASSTFSRPSSPSTERISPSSDVQVSPSSSSQSRAQHLQFPENVAEWFIILKHECKPNQMNCVCKKPESEKLDPLDKFYIKIGEFDCNKLVDLATPSDDRNKFLEHKNSKFVDVTSRNVERAARFLSRILVNTMIGENLDRAPFYDTTKMHEFCGTVACEFKDLAKRYENIVGSDGDSKRITFAGLMYTKIERIFEVKKNDFRKKNGIPTPTTQKENAKKPSNPTPSAAASG